LRRNTAVSFVLCLFLCGSPALASVTYTVTSGDSLWTIAEHYGISVQRLEVANHLTDSSILQLGQQLIVPVTPAAPAPAKPVAVAPPRALHAGPALRHALTKSTNPALRHVATRRHTIRRRLHRAADESVQRIIIAQALWSATHDGNMPASIPGVEPFSVAQHVIALDARITRTAMRFLGVPYTWGGTGFGGVDCSGLVYTVFARNGISLPRMADGQFTVGRRIAMSLLVPGDLVFFETYTSGASHVGIYLGNGRFIHASTRGVVIDQLGMSYYASRYIGARRLVQ
jgi:peptidoglycan DL-endopeptidase LytE